MTGTFMFYVSLATGFGAISRVAIMDFTSRNQVIKKIAFPLSTFFINVLGTLLIAIAIHHLGHSQTEQIIATGFLGGFTTFSTLTNEMIQLWKKHRYTTCLSYGVTTYLSSGIAVILGYFYL